MKAKVIFLLSIFTVPSYACPSLDGVWKSSLSMSRDFNISRSKIEERTREFRDQIIGKSSVTYIDSVVNFTYKKIPEIVIQGKKYPWDSFDITSAYEVLGCTENQLVMKWSAFDTNFITTLNFENDSVYWVYEGMPNGTGNDHTREYFVRERKSN